MTIPNVPNFYQQIPNGGEGPTYGHGNNPSDYVSNAMVGGTPSIQPDTIYYAPSHAFNYGDIAILQAPYQGGHMDLYSYRVKSPMIPLQSMPLDELAYQIFRNGQVVGHGLVLGAPPIPTGGYTPSSVKGR